VKRIFVDGQHGTTGLKIYDLLKAHQGVEIISIPEDKRKDPSEKLKRYGEADLVILCLPDEASREAAVLLKNTGAKVIDSSNAFRTNPDWVYGLPELSKENRLKIKTARLVSNPGCYATGFILASAPLVKSGVLPPDYPAVSYSITGYSGGGRSMIEDFISFPPERSDEICCRPKNLMLRHKHLPEMKKYSGLSKSPHFIPIVGNFYNGMLIFLPVIVTLLNKKYTAEDFRDILAEYYRNESFIRVVPVEESDALGDGFIAPTDLNGTNMLEIFVTGSDDRIMITARLDNLGKGASSAAVQNMNLMLGFDEWESLS
jgi:N-acetyl-gamma-glutamyl-phosphate reductase